MCPYLGSPGLAGAAGKAGAGTVPGLPLQPRDLQRIIDQADLVLHSHLLPMTALHHHLSFRARSLPRPSWSQRVFQLSLAARCPSRAQRQSHSCAAGETPCEAGPHQAQVEHTAASTSINRPRTVLWFLIIWIFK